jgi:hypothetical protein
LALGLAAPSADDEREGARALRSELQATRRGRRKAADLSDDTSEAAMPEALLHDGEDFRILPGFDIDHPIRVKPDTGKSGSEEIPSPKAPQHRAREFGEMPCHKEAGERGMLRGRPGLHDFVNGSKLEASGWKVFVDIPYAEGERITAQCAPPLNSFDLLP